MRLPYAHLLGAVAVATALGCGRNPALEALATERLYEEAFTGFLLADAQTGEVLAERGAHRRYTPASNVKLLTLATSLAWLPQDSLPAMAFRYTGDTLRLWATAYPLLGDGAPHHERLRRRIAAHDGPVEVSLHGFATLPRFGSGWMWDDYAGTYQRERSGMPVYGNLARAWRRSDSSWATLPGFLAVRASEVLPQGQLSRAEDSNRLAASSEMPVVDFGGRPDTLSVPMYNAQGLVAQLLEDWTGRPVRYHADPLPADWGARVWLGTPRDTVLRSMMLTSDNFLAEQLLLAAGLYAHDLTDGAAIRQRAAAEVLPEATREDLEWADASGLSRYNLLSPSGTVALLRDLHARYPWLLLSRLLATGGEAGTTLANDYAPLPGEAPFVWAKTGTLRRNHCLSGFLLGDSGRLLVFSFMHNHFAGGSRAYREAMSRTLRTLKTRY